LFLKKNEIIIIYIYVILLYNNKYKMEFKTIQKETIEINIDDIFDEDGHIKIMMMK
jgi:hypothetical protein